MYWLAQHTPTFVFGRLYLRLIARPLSSESARRAAGRCLVAGLVAMAVIVGAVIAVKLIANPPWIEW